MPRIKSNEIKNLTYKHPLPTALTRHVTLQLKKDCYRGIPARVVYIIPTTLLEVRTLQVVLID